MVMPGIALFAEHKTRRNLANLLVQGIVYTARQLPYPLLPRHFIARNNSRSSNKLIEGDRSWNSPIGRQDIGRTYSGSLTQYAPSAKKYHQAIFSYRDDEADHRYLIDCAP